LATWHKTIGKRIVITVFVKPNAANTKIIGADGRGLIVALNAKPQDGAANKALLEYFCDLFGISKREIILERGESSRYKQLSIPLNEAVQKRLQSVIR
jgi:uncharacterized protein (TIGR00251 family)